MAIKAGYVKRPLWVWILLYVLIGGILYGIVYFVAAANKGGYNPPDTDVPTEGDSVNTQPYRNPNIY